MAVITRQLILSVFFTDKDLVIILTECYEDAFIFKWSKYLSDIFMVTKVALIINILNYDGRFLSLKISTPYMFSET